MKLAINLLLAALIFSAPLSVSAADCSPVNLYEAPDSPLHRIPIYDQGQMNTCYAYTGSQLVDYYRFKKDPKSRDLTPPIWTALIHKLHVPIAWNPDNLDFSRMTWVFTDLEKYGICKEKVVDRAITNLKNGNDQLTESDVMYFFQNLWDEFQTEKGQKITRRARERNYQRAYDKTAADPYFVGKIQYSMAEKFHWIAWGKEGDRLKFLMKEVFSECTGANLEKIALPSRKSIGIGFASNAKIMRGIDNILDSSEPAGIGYCYNVLTEPPGYKGIYVRPRILGMVLNNNNCGAHYSIVVGKRPTAKNGCEYLIRNSYGTGFWTDQWSCYCQTTNKMIPEYSECHASEAQTKGLRVLGCWIDGEDLANNTFDLTHFVQ